MTRMPCFVRLLVLLVVPTLGAGEWADPTASRKTAGPPKGKLLIHGVLERGGVVAGNSAGASILGSSLYAGHGAGDEGSGLLPKTLVGWQFNRATAWSGWTSNAGIEDVSWEAAGVSFRTSGSDPQILSPLFSVPRATNHQWVEIDLEIDGRGQGELFYTNRTTGRYGKRGVMYIHMEAGHAAQNVHLQAVALGLGSVPVGAFDDDAVTDALDLPREQRPLYLIPVGR